MGRRVRSAPLETRTARLKLAQRSDPYFVALGGGLHLGYRRRASVGTWLARARTDDGKYREEKIGLADDYSDADGMKFLDFGQAQRKAQEWGGVRRDAAASGANIGTKYTVANAMTDYLANYEVRGKALSQTKHVVDVKIVPALGKVTVSKLTKVQIRRWLDGIAAEPSKKRGGKARKPAGTDPEAQRKRRATANRIRNVLLAGLNFAFDHDRVPSKAAWANVKPFKGVDVPVVRFLTEHEATRLINAADEDFCQLVQGGLLSGCRYGELTRLKCGDVHAASKSIAIRQAKGGKPRHVFLTDEGVRFFAQMIAGRARDALVFQRSIGRGWRKSEQLRPMLAACKRARITPPVGFHVLRHTHGSWLAMKGTPLQVVQQQLGHADIRMTERHYAHLVPNYVADTVRANLPTLGIKVGRLTELRAAR